MDNKIILSSLAMDLKRVALGLHHKSHTTAGKFLDEALKRTRELKQDDLLPYMQTIIHNVGALGSRDDQSKAEDALLYSVLIQNYVVYKI